LQRGASTLLVVFHLYIHIGVNTCVQTSGGYDEGNFLRAADDTTATNDISLTMNSNPPKKVAYNEIGGKCMYRMAKQFWSKNINEATYIE
jgi:hypothetical protein